VLKILWGGEFLLGEEGEKNYFSLFCFYNFFTEKKQYEALAIAELFL
jgi:hypothetical protein